MTPDFGSGADGFCVGIFVGIAGKPRKNSDGGIVMINRIWKQLKKRLRLRRRWIGLAIVAATVSASALLMLEVSRARSEKPLKDMPVWQNAPAQESALDKLRQEANKHAIDRIRSAGGKYESEMVKQYICGTESISLGQKTARELQQLLDDHPDWELTITGDAKVRIAETIEDLSPACKATAYFGMDDTGHLNLYEGPPENEKVLRTFFQLNVEHMESSLPPEAIQELRKGIRVEDLAQYNSVLSTFNDFAVDDAKKVSKLSGS
ncbi:BofC C-terminal domain-containing protein [Paenibacillus thermoaerophilus]|uniref:BofC C-terminal domain-containing protein n=1 Tax=Paenibacillus thermoaerophilus TaxID=1215385 RepID=A0ABW2UZK4_9BACL|nr:BofC C-terminal domain-containing protein [Paenibacillus thermoaerophilus]TMV17302.1 bypass-of-forespore protein C [Paenibacillus thermoaerophilus]